ncbi:MAG: S4 domain-containing protein [Pseudomonadota bacterium]|uniref:RNA-binding S4 domain-containing protein n=1 Tax=Sphingomonas sp. ERG5 TaxID=1381597 RepID=UPI00054B7E66|nr:S4 domain-containing protein [Sphingomonas sp. ERG5]
MPDGMTMRLDRFLWFARLARTRSAAQAIAANSRLRIDGRPVDRAHTPVRVGCVLTFLGHGGVRAIRVEALPPRRGPAPEARACYTELTENVSQQAACD